MHSEFEHSFVLYTFYYQTRVLSVNDHFLIAEGFYLGVLSYQMIFF